MKYRVGYFICCLLFFPLNSYALTSDSSGGKDKFFVCRETQLGLKFSCDPDWHVHFNDKADLFVISEDPEVVLTVVKEKTKLISLEQLTAQRLKVLGNYADGLALERIEIDGYPAIKVKAYDREQHDVRISDIYLLKDGFLYKFLFSVAPKTKWDQYQFLFKNIVTSLHFLSLTEFAYNF